MSTQILLVEDDREIARVITDHLSRAGCRVTWASTGIEGWEDFRRGEYDLALVDLMLPEMDGFTLCKNIRLVSDMPLLIVSARQQDEDKVRSLNLGADDYLTKPFSLTELQARIESHLRRYRRYKKQEPEEEKWEYAGGLTIFPEQRRVLLRGVEISLTGKELALLLLLANNPQRLFAKEELYEHVWQQADVDGNNTVTVHIKSLRGKLKDNIRQQKFVQTVWGTGYRFVGEQII